MKRDIFNEMMDSPSALTAEYQNPYSYKINADSFSVKCAENKAGHLLVMEPSRERRIGAMKGKFILDDNFDAPLPDELLDAFEGLHV